MPSPIPAPWREAVLRILRTQDRALIKWTHLALQRWKLETDSAWDFEAYDAMIAALSSDGIEGNETTTMQGQAAAYEFLFSHAGNRMYGKIALHSSGLTILIISAHRAERDTLRS
jgi:hypothetical protein